jgi:hypothetical protein
MYYVGRTYTKYTADFTQAVRDLVLAVPTPPANSADPANLIQYEMWKLSVEKHKIKEQEYSNFRAGLYKLVFGQCTKALQDKFKSHSDFPNAYKDGIALLTIIKTLTGLTRQIDSEPETEDAHPVEDEMYRRYGRTGVDRDEVMGVAEQVHTVKKGLKIFGEAGAQTVANGMKSDLSEEATEDAVAPMLGHPSVVSRAPTVVSCLTGTDDIDMESRMGVEPTSLPATVVSCLTGTDDMDMKSRIVVELTSLPGHASLHRATGVCAENGRAGAPEEAKVTDDGDGRAGAPEDAANGRAGAPEAEVTDDGRTTGVDADGRAGAPEGAEMMLKLDGSDSNVEAANNAEP